MHDHESARTRPPVRVGGLVRGQVTAETAGLTAFPQRRFAEKQVGVFGNVDEAVARAGVSRVRERPLSVGDAECVGLDLVVRDAVRRDLQLGGHERLAVLVLVKVEGALEHRLVPEMRAEVPQLVPPVRADPELDARHIAAGAVLRAPHPRHDVAPVIEVEVRDRDRVDARPPLGFPQARKHAGATVEEEAARPLDQIPRLCAPWIRPGGRAADDGYLHRAKHDGIESLRGAGTGRTDPAGADLRRPRAA